MKNINKSTLLLSVILFCFVGCSEKTSLSGGSSNENSSLVSGGESMPEDSPNYEISNAVSQSSKIDSMIETPSFAEVIKIDDLKNYSFDFTEDDLWLRSFLLENWDMAYFLMRTYRDEFHEIGYEQSGIDDEHKPQYFLRSEKYDLPYDLVPNIYFDNAEEYQSLLDKYFFSDGSKIKLLIPKADIVDPENDYISIRGDSHFDEPQLIEINGRLYHAAGCMGTPYLPCSGIAKVMSKTDNEIVYSYLCSVYGDVTAGKGVLKKENGIWKFGWFNISDPIELLDIHEAWGI